MSRFSFTFAICALPVRKKRRETLESHVLSPCAFFFDDSRNMTAEVQHHAYVQEKHKVRQFGAYRRRAAFVLENRRATPPPTCTLSERSQTTTGSRRPIFTSRTSLTRTTAGAPLRAISGVRDGLSDLTSGTPTWRWCGPLAVLNCRCFLCPQRQWTGVCS